jgi:hypothetical protein
MLVSTVTSITPTQMAQKKPSASLELPLRGGGENVEREVELKLCHFED